jgi:hypothetical protein
MLHCWSTWLLMFWRNSAPSSSRVKWTKKTTKTGSEPGIQRQHLAVSSQPQPRWTHARGLGVSIDKSLIRAVQQDTALHFSSHFFPTSAALNPTALMAFTKWPHTLHTIFNYDTVRGLISLWPWALPHQPIPPSNQVVRWCLYVAT